MVSKELRPEGKSRVWLPGGRALGKGDKDIWGPKARSIRAGGYLACFENSKEAM